ncbi:hypothetical protein [Marinobacter sp. F4218]|uniref:hypothetical protein n=1 Tax=Marinobacter sp. F4218 TaxID=2862868 RepID=UPI001C634033|nr:hypothetical protein [Marinobacter sp. F4218]MBW7471153.1 hypothetical protein [Marinobacter sp. F4218]
MEAISLGEYSQADLTAYFKLMRSDGKRLTDDQPTPTKPPDSHPKHVKRIQARKLTHDALINHLMACQRCYAPRCRYCPEGQRLRQDYHSAYEQSLEIQNLAAGLPWPNK